VDKRPKSLVLFARACSVIPGGVNSPVRAFRAVGGDPVFVERGEGPYLFDADDRRYIDLCCSWGPLILGHCHPVVLDAVERAARNGLTFGTVNRLEVELAELVVESVGPVEEVRFVSSGTEAVMSAVRLARGFTGRDKIVKFEGCYHGHADHLLVSAGSGLATFGKPSSAGVPGDFAKHTLVAELDAEDQVNDLFMKHAEEIAAVVVEPVPANCGLLIQKPSYLKFLREITEKHSTLLIFDEVISGFRVGMGGAAGLFEIDPDLMTFGKVIGGGMPVGAFGGRRDIMEALSPNGPVYQAGTLSGNPVAMAAGLAVLRHLQENNSIDHLESLGAHFEDRLRYELNGLEAQVVRIGSVVWIAFQSDSPTRASQIRTAGIELFNASHRNILDAGAYLPPSGYEVMFVSEAHTESILNAAAQAIGREVRARSESP
jgi:glutamate-1-semialdehyde 2,1-aminomutase